MLTISELGEFGLIEKIKKILNKKKTQALLGIGDDAAAVPVSRNKALIISTDTMVDQVHFKQAYTPMHYLGQKALAINLSDIAAMGTAPKFALVTIGLPPGFSAAKIVSIYKGIKKTARAYRVEVVGGDTVAAKQLIISVQVIGFAHPQRIITRSRANIGDKIFVSGCLGDAAIGLDVLKGKLKGKKNIEKRLINAHLLPVPQVKIGLALRGIASAMIDNSDGLGRCIQELCSSGKVGAIIYADKMPFSKAARQITRGRLAVLLRYALNGGEDYNLVFTVPSNRLAKLNKIRHRFVEIGEITAKGIKVKHEGKVSTGDIFGYDHFKKAGQV